jgi:hypothetical protein
VAINETILKRFLRVAIAAALLSVSTFAMAQWSSELSADLPDARTMAVQAKVDELFEAGDFRRAFFIFQNELAPIGDKYAQYMVGYMLLNGLGVPKDPATASAWYRLAAERGTPEFVAVSDSLLRQLGDRELQKSNAEYYRLRAEYSDVAVLLTSIRRNLKELGGKTGSLIGAGSSPMTVIGTGAGRPRSGDDYYGYIYSQLEKRLSLLREMDGFHDIETDPTRLDIRELERRAQVRIESLD